MMPTLVRALSALALGSALAGGALVPGRAHAGSPQRSTTGVSGCAAGEVCDPALGVALTPPRGWTVPPPGHFPPTSLAFWTSVPGRSDATLHLTVEPRGMSTARTDAQAVTAEADKAVRGVPTLTITRTATTVAGAPAVILSGMPGEPDFGQEILVAHGGKLYGIYTFDSARTTLTPAQRQALDSLRFIPRAASPPAQAPATSAAGMAASRPSLSFPCAYEPRAAVCRLSGAGFYPHERVSIAYTLFASPARGAKIVATYLRTATTDAQGAFTRPALRAPVDPANGFAVTVVVSGARGDRATLGVAGAP